MYVCMYESENTQKMEIQNFPKGRYLKMAKVQLYTDRSPGQSFCALGIHFNEIWKTTLLFNILNIQI